MTKSHVVRSPNTMPAIHSRSDVDVHNAPRTEPFLDSGLLHRQSPELIPGYRLVGELGRGGMGVVYEAIDVAHDRTVAIKLVLDRGEQKPGPKPLVDEAAAAARLNHPNIVRVYSFGEAAGAQYIVLELVRGESLSRKLRDGPLPLVEAIDFVRVLARAMQHAHDRGVIHRDLKPGNVLLVDGTPKIVDFGLAKMLDQDTRTRTGLLFGTPQYVAPELVVGGSKVASPSSDVYALGVILYECLTGRMPFDGPTAWDVMRQAAEDDPESPRTLRPEVPATLNAVCLKALAKTPSGRYASASALAADLDRVSSGGPVNARVRRRPWILRRVGWKSLAAAALVGIAVASTLAAGLRDRNGANDRLAAAAASARAGERMLARGDYDDAQKEFETGLRQVEGVADAATVTAELNRGVKTSTRGRLVTKLQTIVDRFRLGFDQKSHAGESTKTQAQAASELWAARDGILNPEPGTALTADVEEKVKLDLLDLGLLSADLIAADGEAGAADRAAARLAEVEATLGANPVVSYARAVRRAEAKQGPAPPVPELAASASMRELYAFGRALLNSENPAAAIVLLRRAVDREPTAFWPGFTLGLAAYQLGRNEEAAEAFSRSSALTKAYRGRCYFHLGLAHAAGGNRAAALDDFNRALELEPTFAATALNRGLVQLELANPKAALGDFLLAERLGYPAGTARYNQALAYEAVGERGRALAAAREAIERDPTLLPARRLVNKLASTAD